MNCLYHLENTLILYFHLSTLVLRAPSTQQIILSITNNLRHFEVHVIHMVRYGCVVFTRQIAEFFRPEWFVCFVFFNFH